jgi:hypothetical protein
VDTMRALKQVVIFKDVPDRVLQIVADAAEDLTIPAGETIVSATHALNALYVIRNGTVRALPEDPAQPLNATAFVSSSSSNAARRPSSPCPKCAS